MGKLRKIFTPNKNFQKDLKKNTVNMKQCQAKTNGAPISLPQLTFYYSFPAGVHVRLDIVRSNKYSPPYYGKANWPKKQIPIRDRNKYCQMETAAKSWLTALHYKVFWLNISFHVIKVNMYIRNEPCVVIAADEKLYCFIPKIGTGVPSIISA